jgi:hypothetical protein
MFNIHTFEVHRLSTTAGEKKAYADTTRRITGRLSAQDIEFGAIAGSGYGKTYQLFVNGTGIDLIEGDRLVEGAVKYDVKGVQEYPHAPIHTEVILERVIKQ